MQSIISVPFFGSLWYYIIMTYYFCKRYFLIGGMGKNAGFVRCCDIRKGEVYFCVSAYGERETLIALKRSMKGRVTYGECNISWRYPYV